MFYKTVHLFVNVNEGAQPNAAIDYAVEFARREGAHLSSLAVAQIVDFALVRILPLADAIIEQINDECLAKAKAIAEHIEVTARLAGVSADCSVVHTKPDVARRTVIAAARLCDLVVTSQPNGLFSAEEKLIENVVFNSGRPVLVVPPEWTSGPALEKVVVAWDGGARAARAVGDAAPLLNKAVSVEVVHVTADASHDFAGTELARHLSRRCANLNVTVLPMKYADAGKTLLDHLSSMRASLLVMGAFAHPRLLEYVVGGTTSMMLTDARIPVLYSY
jgi:nucleotide-binding universal stress UspA family protein